MTHSRSFLTVVFPFRTEVFASFEMKQGLVELGSDPTQIKTRKSYNLTIRQKAQILQYLAKPNIIVTLLGKYFNEAIKS